MFPGVYHIPKVLLNRNPNLYGIAYQVAVTCQVLYWVNDHFTDEDIVALKH